MTLLENIYYQLHNSGLVKNREHFSTFYLGKSKNWYAVQTYNMRDFSTSAAINCIAHIRFTIKQLSPTKNQQTTLRAIENLIFIFIRQKYPIESLYLNPNAQPDCNR